MLNKLSSKQKGAGAAFILVTSVVLIRSFVYRPAQKQHSKDLLVPVERSGGGV